MKKALIISADGFEDTELFVPYYRLLEEWIVVDIASLNKGKIKGKKGYEIEANLSFAEVKPQEYDMLIIPGGKAPEAIRSNPDVAKIVHYFFDSDKMVAAICHGPQVLISAGVMEGKRATSYPTVVPELENAGVLYEDASVIIDDNLITSRKPADLPAFMREIIKRIGKNNYM